MACTHYNSGFKFWISPCLMKLNAICDGFPPFQITLNGVILSHAFVPLNVKWLIDIWYLIHFIYTWFTLFISLLFKSHCLHKNMANNDIQALLSYHALTGMRWETPLFCYTYCIVHYIFLILIIFLVLLPAPLNPNPTSKLEKIVNDLRIKYITYVVEFNVEHVSHAFFMYLLLPSSRNSFINMLFLLLLTIRAWLFC